MRLCVSSFERAMKIAWLLLLVWTWAPSSGDVAAQLRFAAEESLDEILEDESHRLTPVQLETSPGVPLTDEGEQPTWSQAYYQLLISCDHGTLQLDREAERRLVDTTFLCVSRDGDFQQNRSIGVVTTVQEAQQILSLIVYEPDLNYHSTWFGVTDPRCITGNDGNEIVRMQLSPVTGDTPRPSTDTCSAGDLGDTLVSASDPSSTHEKKISVTSVNDPPTLERELGRDLYVPSRGSCIGLSGFTLDDAEAAAVESDPNAVVPILTLQLNVNGGTLRVNRRSALQSGIHAVGSGKNAGDATLAWKLPDLFDSSLVLKGAISDLNGFLPQVEYCSSPDFTVVAPDTLRVTLSDNGFCGGFEKEGLSASLVVPVHILPAADLGELLVSKTNVTLTTHSTPAPLRYTPGRADEVECTLELKYGGGMLLGIDYQEGMLYGKPNPVSLDASRSSAELLIPASGLIVRFRGDKSKRESTIFKFTRNVCAIQEVCQQLESVALYEDSSDEEIIVAAQILALNGESVTELQVARYPVSRLWLIWNIAHTFSHAVMVSMPSQVSVQIAERRFRLQGMSGQIAAQLNNLNVYSLIGGVWSHNRLNVTISTLNDAAIRSQDVLTGQLDIFAIPVLENVKLLHPLELTLGKSSELSLESTLISYPCTYIASTALRWNVRSALGLIWWDPSSVSSAVVSRQVSKFELELRGNLVDLNAALPSIRVDESAVQDDYNSFANFYEEQTYELLAVALTKTLSVQALSTSSTEGSIAGNFLLGLDLPARRYLDLDLDIASGHCKSTTIGANDDLGDISRKITQMDCDVVPAKTSDEVFRREVQSIRVLALYPARVDELVGTFRVSFLGQSTDPISLKASIGTIKTTILKVVVDANGIEVSRNELPGENGFEWQVTFGTEGDVHEAFKAVYDETSVPFKVSTVVLQTGQSATDLRLDTFYPGISLSVQRIKSASSGSLALELSFSSVFDDLPILSVEASTLASTQTAQFLDVAVKGSKSTVISGETEFFRLQVQNNVTFPLASCANASTVENAIRDLHNDRLRVSVKRKASAFVPGRFDYAVVMSAPSLLTLNLVADGAAPLSKALFRSSLIDPGREIQIAMDTISMSLETLDNSTLVASGEMHAWVSRWTKKLGIRLPASYLKADFNEALVIDGIGFQGYAHKLNFTISCTKGTVNLLHKQPVQHLLHKMVDSTLMISGYFSTLEEALRHSHLLYSPRSDATGYDKLVFTVESLDDQASEILPIAINFPMKPPHLTLPASPISVFENENISIAGVMLNLADNQEHILISSGITVNITARDGHVELMTDEPDHRLLHSTDIQIQGDAENINAALKGLRYRSPVTGAPTEDQILFATHWSSDSGGQASSATFSIPIKIVRRPLTINVLLGGKVVGDGSVVTTKMNTAVSLESLLFQVDGDDDGHWSYCNGIAPAIAGVDGDPCKVTINLSLFAGQGLISNHTEPFSQSRVQDSSMSVVRFDGSVAQASRFLQQQTYLPDATFHGPDQVVINIKYAASATDDGATVHDTILLPVFVSPDCGAPQLLWTESGTNAMSLSSSTKTPFTLPEILIAREGLEKGYCQDDTLFRVVVKSDQGYITLKSGAATASFDDPRTLVLEGRIWDLNLALASAEYRFEIQRHTQIPVTARIEVRLLVETNQETDLRGVVSSALLRLKFVGDTRLSDMLARETIMGFEDTDVFIGDVINLDGFSDLTDDSTIIIHVHNGVVYAAANGVNMEAGSEQQVSTSDKRHLRSIVSNLHYSPNSHFSGIDEINFRSQNQENTLYIYVQAENDPPEFSFNSYEIKDWYTYPRKFIPSFQLNDPDKNQMFQVDIRAENGSLLLDQMSSSTFDGITVELSALASSLRMKSSLSRLNTIFLQRLIEVIPNSCVKEGSMGISCAASIELCVGDGFISVCEELHLPAQDLFYHVSVADWAKILKISTHSSLNISKAFEIQQAFDVVYDLCLRVYASSGFILMDVPTCGELRDVAGADQLQRSHLIGTAQTIHASDVACMNKVLASMQLQSTYSVNDSIVVQLELFSEEMRLLANASISVKVTGATPPKRISTVRTTHNDEPWLVRLGHYAKLTSLANVSILVSTDSSQENEADEDMLELNVSCSICQWRYQALVPRVSYEFARVPSSKLRFLGLSDSLNTVLATLELTVASSDSSGYEAIHFQLAPAAPLGVQGTEPIWSESRIEIRFTVVKSVQEVFGDEASEEMHFRSLVQPPTTFLVPSNSSVVIRLNEEEVRSIGNVVDVSGDINDPTWFRMEARVAHGRLSIPTNVCCVDIRETRSEKELDVVGSALALRQVLTAAQFQGNKHFWGKDSLEVTIAYFSSNPHQPNVSLSIPIEIIAINHAPTITHYQHSGVRSDSLFPNEHFILNDVDLMNLDYLETPSASLFRVTLSSMTGVFLVDDSATRKVSVIEFIETETGYSNFTFEAPLADANAVLARVSYVAKSPELKCAENNEMFVAVSDQGHGIETWVPKQAFSAMTISTCENNQQLTNELSVQQPMYDLSDQSLVDPDYRALVGTDLEVQQIRVLPPPYQQLISKINVPPSEAPSISGTFSLQADSNFRGVKRTETAVLYADAVAMVSDESKESVSNGRAESNSVQAKVISLYGIVGSFADLGITSQVDAPVISVPHALEDPSPYMSDYLSVLRLECLPLVCDEDIPMALDGLSVRAADTTHTQVSMNDLLVISLSVSHGVISLGDTWRTNCISQFVGAQSWKRIVFKTSVDCTNRVLMGMEYVGEPNFSGADQLTVRVEYAREWDAAFDEVTFPVVVVELNDAPYIEVASVFYEAEEDTPLVIDDLHLRDPDALDERLRVTMTTSHGQLALLRPNGVKLTTETVTSAGLTLEGTLRNLDAAIASVVYTSAKDWNSLQFRPDNELPGMNGFDIITIASTDLSSFNGSSVSMLFVYVDPKPDPVVIDLPSNGETSIYADDPPGTLRGDEDTWINVRGLVFSSVDDTARATLTVSLSVTHGLLSLAHVRGLTFLEGTTDEESILKLKGTFANVNACMIGLRYLPTKNFYGHDSLVVTANAVDEYTQQQSPSSFIRVAITVNAVNNRPVWNVGSSIVHGIQQGRAASIAGISFHDVDVDTLDCAVESCVMDLIIEASDGFVTLPDRSLPRFSNDMTTKKVAHAVISGTPDQLNVLLSEMTFELADPEYYRADSPSRSDIKLQLTVDDRGTHGWGGPQISPTTVMFSPVTWSRYGVSILAPEDVLTLDEDTAFIFDGDLQLADPDSARSLHNLLELSITCAHGVLALSSRATGVQVLRNDSDGDIVIRGFFAQLNAALNGSYYIPAANWHGSEELSLSVVESNNLEKSKQTAVASTFLFVAPVCDEPRWITLTDDPLTMKEDGYLLIDTLSLTNPDLDDEQREVEVTIGVKHGGVMLSMTRGLLIHQTVYSTSEDRLVAQHAPPGKTFSSSRLFFRDLVIRGRVSDINAALTGMVFKPWLDYNSDGWPVDEIVLSSRSACGKTATNHVTIPIAVDAVNDPPVLISQHFQPVVPSYSLAILEAASWPSSIEAIEDSPQQLESTELYDPDYDLRSGDFRLLINVSCIHCTITSEYLSHSFETQPSDDLIVVTRNWESDEGVQLVVHGNLASLNKGLVNQLIFRGADNFNGLAYVLVEISDLGNYGEQGELRSVFVLGVKVKSVNDIPQIHLPQYQSQDPVLQLDEGGSILIQGARALSALVAPAQRQPSEWNLMIADLLVHDSSSRLRSLHQFSGSTGLAASFLVTHSGGLLFSARDTDFGQELWCSDGTAVGTILLKDIFPGSGDSQPSYLTPFSKDNRVYFAAEGPHLSWLVKDDYRDACQSFRPSSFDPNVFFTVAAQNVWDPDETYDCPLGFRWMSTSEAHQVFVGTIAMEGHSDEPFTYFDQCGWHGYEWGGQTRKYFRFSDSKTTGAFKHGGFRDSYRIDTGLQTDLFAGIVCYREPPAYQITWGAQLWATDGTAEGTTRVARISTGPEGSNPSHFVELNQRLYFQATSTEFGSELWSTDGTRAGTYLVADVEFGSRSSKPQFLTAFDSRVFFSAETQDYGRELWFSDGDPRFAFTEDQHATVGTDLLRDICVGAKSSSPQHFALLRPIVGSPLLLFQADDCVHGLELWSTDGTRAGTTLVQDIREGSVGSFPVYLTSFAGQVYFQADDGIHGPEFWTTDGTSVGTVMLFDIAPGVLGSKPSFFTIRNGINAPSGELVFAAQAERDLLTEFWRSDGSSVGTTKLFPQSREVVGLNTDSLNLQLAGQKFASIPSQPQAFFYLGRENGHGHAATDRSSVAHAEDVVHTRSITLQDVESMQSTSELTVSLNCSKGWLSLGRQCDGATVRMGGTPDNKKAAVLTLKGSLGALNCAVEKVTYHANPQENGWDEIHVTLGQGVLSAPGEANGTTNTIGDTERDSSYSVSKRMLVEIRAINDPPTISMASTFYSPTGEWVALAGIEVTDPDSAEGILYVSIAVHNGRLRVTLPPDSGPTGLHPAANEDTSQMLEFATTAEQAKEIFGALEYSCDDDYACSNSRSDYLTVQVDDNGFTGARGPQTATKTAEVVVITEA